VYRRRWRPGCGPRRPLGVAADDEAGGHHAEEEAADAGGDGAGDREGAGAAGLGGVGGAGLGVGFWRGLGRRGGLGRDWLGRGGLLERGGGAVEGRVLGAQVVDLLAQLGEQFLGLAGVGELLGLAAEALLDLVEVGDQDALALAELAGALALGEGVAADVDEVEQDRGADASLLHRDAAIGGGERLGGGDEVAGVALGDAFLVGAGGGLEVRGGPGRVGLARGGGRGGCPEGHGHEDSHEAAAPGAHRRHGEPAARGSWRLWSRRSCAARLIAGMIRRGHDLRTGPRGLALARGGG
jgi:hypothetical protein